MVALVDENQVKMETLKDDSFVKYIERSTEYTTVNGTPIAKGFSWYKKILGLF